MSQEPKTPWTLVCSVCKRGDVTSTVRMAWTERAHNGTTDIYWDELGQRHIHDPNVTTDGYLCSNGHEFEIAREAKCSPCERKKGLWGPPV